MGKKIVKPDFFSSKDNLPKGISLIDAFTRSLSELFFIDNPKYKKEMPESKKLLDNYLKKSKVKGVWIYFSWRKAAVYTLPESLYFRLRTARNREIITEKEQTQFRRGFVGIVGLSVGSVLLSSLVSNGGPKNFRLADFDEIEVTNLNRMKATVLDIGRLKTDVAAANVWELDPFANLDLWSQGVNKKNLEKFILGKPKLHLFVDAMDSLDLKILARFICKKHKIPVIMITENGDNSILDVERYDKDKNLLPFQGRIGNARLSDFKNLNYKEWLRLASKIVGAEFLSPEMQSSILKLGRSIASVPQLSTSVSVGGAGAAKIIRRILCGKPMPTGRYLINLDEKIIPGYRSNKQKLSRSKLTKKFILSLTGR